MYRFFLHRTANVKTDYAALFSSDTWVKRKKKFESLIRRGKLPMVTLVGMTYEQVLIAPFDKLVDIYYEYKRVRTIMGARDVKALKRCFPYDAARTNIQMFIESRMSIDDTTTCPYCDCNEIHVYPRGGAKRDYQLDHYLDKGECPIVALSLYNLVPVCPLCNKEKHANTFGNTEADTKSLSPFNTAYDFENHVRFKVSLGDITKIRSSKTYQNMDVSLEPDNGYEWYEQETSITKIMERYYNNKESKVHKEITRYYAYLYAPRPKIYKIIERALGYNRVDAYPTLPTIAEHRMGMRVPYDKFRRDMIEQMDL